MNKRIIPAFLMALVLPVTMMIGNKAEAFDIWNALRVGIAQELLSDVYATPPDRPGGFSMEESFDGEELIPALPHRPPRDIIVRMPAPRGYVEAPKPFRSGGRKIAKSPDRGRQAVVPAGHRTVKVNPGHGVTKNNNGYGKKTNQAPGVRRQPATGGHKTSGNMGSKKMRSSGHSERRNNQHGGHGHAGR